MPEENIYQEFRLKKIDVIRTCFVEEINQNELMSKMQKTVCKVLNCIDHLPIVISTITGCVFISTFASLVDTPVGIKSSTNGLDICAVTGGIKKWKSIINKKSIVSKI